MFVFLALSAVLGCTAQANEGQSGGLEVAVYEYECDPEVGFVEHALATEASIFQVESCSTEIGRCVPAYEAGLNVRRDGPDMHIPCGGGFGIAADVLLLKVIQ